MCATLLRTTPDVTRWGRGLLASCSLIYLCLVGAGHVRPAAWEAAGTCTPKLSYSMGNVTCYGPAQVAQAERRLLRPPLRPVAAVWRVAHLLLDQVDAMQLGQSHIKRRGL